MRDTDHRSLPPGTPYVGIYEIWGKKAFMMLSVYLPHLNSRELNWIARELESTEKDFMKHVPKAR